APAAAAAWCGRAVATRAATAARTPAARSLASSRALREALRGAPLPFLGRSDVRGADADPHAGDGSGDAEDERHEREARRAPKQGDIAAGDRPEACAEPDHGFAHAHGIGAGARRP